MLADAKKAKLSKRETYQAMELSAYASLDLGDVATCERHVRALESVFPKSARVGRLLGCMLEAEGRHDDAIALYDDLLAQAPAEQRLMKRRIACLKAAGRVEEAIKALTSYLDTFMGDVAAWEEAAALYAARGDFARRLLLGGGDRRGSRSSEAPPAHRGDLLHVGGLENLRAAQVLRRRVTCPPPAMRAMYGLVLVDKRLKDFEKTSKGAPPPGAAGDVAAGDLGSELGRTRRRSCRGCTAGARGWCRSSRSRRSAAL